MADTLPRKIRIKRKKKEPEKEFCAICHTDIDIGQKSQKLKCSCNYVYHLDCITRWYQMTISRDRYYYLFPRSCPICYKDGGYISLLDGSSKIKDIHY